MLVHDPDCDLLEGGVKPCNCEPDVYVLVLLPEASPVPPAIRLRQLLKRCKRDWRLRCLSITAASPVSTHNNATIPDAGERPDGAEKDPHSDTGPSI